MSTANYTIDLPLSILEGSHSANLQWVKNLYEGIPINTKRWVLSTGLILFGLLFGLAGCMAATPTLTPTPLATLSLEQTSAKEMVLTDFDAVHSPVNGDANENLILGNPRRR